jgi:hypothetical protein
MAKKTRPTFSAPSDKPAPRTRDSQWVYRSDVAPAVAGKAPRPAARRTTVTGAASTVAPAVAPPRSGGVVNCAALLLFPVALLTGLVLEPLAACCRRKIHHTETRKLGSTESPLF